MKGKMIIIAMTMGLVYAGTVFAQLRSAPIGQQETSSPSTRGLVETCPEYQLVLGGMLDQSLAVGENSVYVLLGTEIYKYDRDLNFQKKQEIQIDTAAIQRLLDDLGIQCGSQAPLENE